MLYVQYTSSYSCCLPVIYVSRTCDSPTRITYIRRPQCSPSSRCPSESTDNPLSSLLELKSPTSSISINTCTFLLWLVSSRLPYSLVRVTTFHPPTSRIYIIFIESLKLLRLSLHARYSNKHIHNVHTLHEYESSAWSTPSAYPPDLAMDGISNGTRNLHMS